eukprot:scaffold19033_cov60-Phaeocystis_antarctica.AAC.1
MNAPIPWKNSYAQICACVHGHVRTPAGVAVGSSFRAAARATSSCSKLRATVSTETVEGITYLAEYAVMPSHDPARCCPPLR